MKYQQMNHRGSGYGTTHATSPLNMGCFATSAQRPSAAGISLASQTTGFSAITGTTTTTATSTGTSTGDDLALIRSRNQRDGKDRMEGKDVVTKQKKGILNKLFKFGSKKEKKSAPLTSQDQDSDPEYVQTRRQELSEQRQIQEQVRRIKEQDLLFRHQQQYQQHQMVQHQQMLDDGDKYGHYMNHHQIQEQMRTLGVPVAYSNRPVARRTNPQPPPPLPPGRPQMQSAPRMRHNVTSPTTVIDARGAAISRERPLSNYYEYESASNLQPNPSAMNPNAIYEQRLLHQQLMQQQQQQEAQRLAQMRQQLLKQQLHEAAMYQQHQGPAGLTRLQSPADVYGVISPEAAHRNDANLFRRQLSNHRIVPSSQSIPTRVRQPVYQDQNVYVYSNPPTGFSEHPIYGTRGGPAAGVPQSVSGSSIYGTYFGPSKPPPALHPTSHHSLQHLQHQQKVHHSGPSFYAPVSHHVNPATGSNV